MKTTKILIALLVIICSSVSIFAQDSEQKKDKVEVYYFHNKARCVTCKAIENESKNAVMDLYPKKFKSGLITFKGVNLEDKINESLLKKLEISGQTLLIVKADKKINLTNEGFLYARTNPKKLKEIIKKNIDSIL
ncbi:nitrophenyl compound nitroreductase subunit ArsF family protein [Bacteroidota bacterium]